MANDDFKQTLLAAFQVEAAELLGCITAALKQSWSSNTAQELFRHFHNLKGTAQLLEFDNFANAAQTAETLARSGQAAAQPELIALHEYLSQCLMHINAYQTESAAYVSTSADNLLARIASREATQKKEQQALFQLFNKQLNNLNTDDKKTQNSSLKTLIRAADLMELNDLSIELNALAATPQQANNKKLQQQLLEKLIEHQKFGHEFMNFYQKANS